MDYFVWGYMKRKVNEMKITGIDQLKKAVEKVCTELAQELIDRALAAWPNGSFIGLRAIR